MLECLLYPCAVASLRKGVLSGALCMLAHPSLSWFSFQEEWMNCSGNALDHGRDAQPVFLPRHKHLHLKIVGKSQKASCQLCYAPGAMLNSYCVPSYLVLLTILTWVLLWLFYRWGNWSPARLGTWPVSFKWGVGDSNSGPSDPKPVLDILSHPKEKLLKRLYHCNSQC